MQFLGDPWSTRPDVLVARARAQNAWDALDAVLKERVLSAMLEQRESLSLLSSNIADVVTLALDAPPDLRASWGTMFDLVTRAAGRPNFGAVLVDPAMAPGAPARALLLSVSNTSAGILRGATPYMLTLAHELARLHLVHIDNGWNAGTGLAAVVITPFGTRIAEHLSARRT